MLAVVINAALVLVGSVIGLLLKSKISEKLTKSLMHGLALCVMVIGIMSAIKTQDILCVIICMVVGILIGEFLRIEDRLDGLGKIVKSKFVRKGDSESRFVEGFMTTTLLFCVGSMAITGSMEAGINQNYSIIISKSVIDAVTSISFAATMGIGVCFSSLGVFVYQGLLTVLFILVGPFISAEAINEMSAVGGLAIIAISLNMLDVLPAKIRSGNMLPAIFLPLAYIPLSNLIQSLF